MPCLPKSKVSRISEGFNEEEVDLICRHVRTEAESIDIDKIIKGQARLSFMSKSVLKQLQADDEELFRVKLYLTSGNRALLRDNKCPQVKRYLNSGAKIA